MSQPFDLSRRETIAYIEFKNVQSFQDVERLRNFKEHQLTGVFTSKVFRYSWDNSIWTNWNTLSEKNITEIKFRDNPNFWIEIRYYRATVNAGNIDGFMIFYDSKSPQPVPPIPQIIDADLLQGEDGEFYLDRSNHIGPYYGLNILNLPDGSTIGVYDSRIDTSAGSTFYFRRIGGAGGINVTQEAFGKIIIDGSAIRSDISKLDSSVSNLYSIVSILDSSISYLVQWNSSIEASIADLYSRESSIGVINVGDGSAGVFAGFDSSNNIRLRTFVSGSPQATIEEIGDQIRISIDASYSGEVNYGVNLGGGDASVYFGKSLEALQFREIKGIGSVVVSTSDNLILIDSSGSAGTYDTSLDPSLAMPTSVGGIPAGTTVNSLKGDSFIQLFDSLLFPTVNPTYVAPNNSFADNVANLQEIGASINITFTAGFNRGQILLNSVFQNYRSGLPNSYNYTGFGLPGAVPSTSLSNIQNLVGYTVLQGNQSWANTVSYDIGPQPLDSKGNPYGTPLVAGTTSSKSTSLEGVYPLFGTTALISNPDTKQPLVSMISANNIVFNMVSESSGYKQSFDIPNSWIGSRPLIGVETFNSFSLSWEYQGGTAATSLASWSTSSVTQNIQGNAIPYTRYTYNGIDRSSIQIRLKF